MEKKRFIWAIICYIFVCILIVSGCSSRDKEVSLIGRFEYEPVKGHLGFFYPENYSQKSITILHDAFSKDVGLNLLENVYDGKRVKIKGCLEHIKMPEQVTSAGRQLYTGKTFTSIDSIEIIE